jgi:hypothetical protein
MRANTAPVKRMILRNNWSSFYNVYLSSRIHLMSYFFLRSFSFFSRRFLSRFFFLRRSSDESLESLDESVEESLELESNFDFDACCCGGGAFMYNGPYCPCCAMGIPCAYITPPLPLSVSHGGYWGIPGCTAPGGSCPAGTQGIPVAGLISAFVGGADGYPYGCCADCTG